MPLSRSCEFFSIDIRLELLGEELTSSSYDCNTVMIPPDNWQFSLPLRYSNEY